MWILVLVVFSGAMQIDRMEVLETYWNEKKCMKRVKEAEKVGLPKNTNIGCLHIDGISQT